MTNKFEKDFPELKDLLEGPCCADCEMHNTPDYEVYLHKDEVRKYCLSKQKVKDVMLKYLDKLWYEDDARHILRELGLE